MADALGTTASIIAVIQLSAQVASLSFKYISAVKRAPEDLIRLDNELKTLTTVLSNLEVFERENPEVTSLWKLDEPLQKFIHDMKDLKAKLEPKKSWWGLPLARLQWPIQEKETLDYILRIEGLKALFILAMNSDQISRTILIEKNMHGIEAHLQGHAQRIETYVQGAEAHAQRIETHVQDIRADQESDILKEEKLRFEQKRTRVLDWLYPAAFDKRHIEISDRRQKNTGQWILSAPEIQEWRKSPKHPIIWGYGIPGAGKTFLSSLVVDDLQDQAHVDNYGVAYIYFGFNEQHQQGPRDVLSSLVKQLAYQMRIVLPKEIEDLHDRLSSEQKRPKLEELYGALLGVLRSAAFTQTFVICDALDECNPEQRKVLLPMLHQMGNDGVKLFLTSREYPEDIQDSLKDSLKIKLWAKEEDTARYIGQKIEENTRAKRLVGAAKCKDRIIADLSECANGMFLLVHFHIEHLCQQTTLRQILGELEKIKSSTNEERPLDPTYNRALAILRMQPRNCTELAIKILSWLVKAQRVLTVRELQLAVSVEEGQDTFDESDLPDEKTLLDVCASLVTIDKNSNTARLAHYTVKEYIMRNQIIPEDAGPRIAISCITFLSFDIFACPCDPKNSLRTRNNLYPFLNYVTEHLSYHLRRYDEPLIIELVFNFLKRAGNISSYIQALEAKKNPWEDYCDYSKGLSSLHVAVVLAHYGTTQSLLEKGADLSATDNQGRTALNLAVASYGCESIARLLLEKGADLSATDNEGRTALHLASSYGHESIVQLLLEKGADLSATDNWGQTALHLASTYEHESIVQLLLEKGADLSATDNEGQTALHLASSYGRESIARLLLEKGADLSATDNEGQTALHLASRYRCGPIAQLLLEKGTDLSATDNEGQTALHLASSYGHESIVQLLLEKGADLSATDNQGRTALHLASTYEHESIVQLLLEKGADLSATDNEGRTALHLASSYGHESIVQLLLEKGADLSATDNWGRTALHLASTYEHESIVQLLLEKGADLSATDNEGRTALHLASRYRCGPIAQLLLEKGTDLSATDNEGQTALHLASTYEHESIVQLLLEKGADLSATENTGQTPIDWATVNGHTEVVQLLSKRSAKFSNTSKVRAEIYLIGTS